jgi:hypothetical protein
MSNSGGVSYPELLKMVPYFLELALQLLKGRFKVDDNRIEFFKNN